jgi:four helix bundle protein
MAKNFRELVSWQLAFELNERIQQLLRSGAAANDFKFRDQLADSARSAPRNIAEGFGRFNPTEIAQFVDYARASLDETENHLRDAAASGYFAPQEVGPLILLLVRCRKALAGWHTYLRGVKDDPRFNQGRRRR